MREVMTDLRTICDEGIRLSTMVPYRLASNGIGKPAIGVLTNVTRDVLRNGLWRKARRRPFSAPCAIVAKSG